MYIATFVVINTVTITELKPDYLHTVACCSNISKTVIHNFLNVHLIMLFSSSYISYIAMYVAAE